MGFRKKFYKNLLTYGGFSYTSQIINFASSIILARLLLPEEFGTVALIVVFSDFIRIFADAGLSYEVIRTNYKETYYKTIHNVSFYLGAILFCVMLLLAYPITLFYNEPSLLWPIIFMSLFFIPQNLTSVPSAIIAKRLQFKEKGIIDISSTLLIVVGSIIMAYFGASYWSLIIPRFFGIIGVYIAYTTVAKFPFKIYKFNYTIIGFRKAKTLLGSISGFNVINYWARNVDNLLVGKFYGSADLGIYNRAYRFINLSLTMITGLIGAVLMPSFKLLISEGKKINDEYDSILGIISLVNFPIAVILIGIPKYFVLVMWGNNWLEVATLLPYFGVLILTQTLLSTTGQVYVLLKKEKTLFYIGSGTAIIIIISIVAGVISSLVDVAKYYSLAFTLIVIPIHLYFGFYKALGFDAKGIIRLWGPKVTLSIALILCIWIEQQLFVYGLLLIYGIHLIIAQRKDLVKLIQIIKSKLKK